RGRPGSRLLHTGRFDDGRPGRERADGIDGRPVERRFRSRDDSVIGYKVDPFAVRGDHSIYGDSADLGRTGR
ncbi:MAG: hypothetical protein WB765_05615, partial [Acidimicrobiales bacterium]